MNTAELILADSAMSYAFTNSDLMGQSICVVLFLFSIAVWVVMLEKIITLRQAMKDIRRFMRQFSEKRNPLYYKESVVNDPSPAARIFQAACERIETFKIDIPGGGRRTLNDDELAVIKSTMAQEVEEQITIFEKRTMFLATAVSASPFLGLFGTVWGITIAFTNLAIQGKADIQTLAPGVSGALLTTVIALFVAIPSLVGYNIIGGLIKNLTVKLDDFSEEISARLKIEQMESVRAFQERK